MRRKRRRLLFYGIKRCAGHSVYAFTSVSLLRISNEISQSGSKVALSCEQNFIASLRLFYSLRIRRLQQHKYFQYINTHTHHFLFQQSQINSHWFCCLHFASHLLLRQSGAWNTQCVNEFATKRGHQLMCGQMLATVWCFTCDHHDEEYLSNEKSMERERQHFNVEIVSQVFCHRNEISSGAHGKKASVKSAKNGANTGEGGKRNQQKRWEK